MARRNKEDSTQIELSQESILNAAIRNFRDKGYRASSLEDVAVSLGVTRPSLYYYFKSKEEILIAAHRKAVEKLFITEDIMADDELSVQEKFEKILTNHIQVVASNARLIGIAFEEEKELPKNDPRIVDYHVTRRQYNETLVELYRQGVQEGIFRDVDPYLAVFAILGACNWTYRWFREGEKYDSAQVARSIVKIMAEGYLSPSG